MEAYDHTIYFKEHDLTLVIRREDLRHPTIPGNKLRKLKYNLIAAEALGFDTLLTFGGAFSNHIAAVAACGMESGMKTIGMIRGEELVEKVVDNPTLARAREDGMRLNFISREEYRRKDDPEFVNELEARFGKFYLLPEGGTNAMAVKGCAEILSQDDESFDYICTPVGTGGTMAGLVNGSSRNQKVLGFPALKGEFIEGSVSRFAEKDNWKIVRGYEFGGYGKIDLELVAFINRFFAEYQVPSDPIYTGKMFFGVMDMIAAGKFERGARILAIHTGGLQGIQGMNNRLKNKNLPLIQFYD